MMSPSRTSYRALGAVSALGAAAALSGCPGTLDPQIAAMVSQSGNATGGSGGSGGTSGTGGSPDCTGNNDVNYVIMGTGDSKCPGLNCMACAQVGCHVPGALSADLSGGLDLTLDSNIGSRLIGVMSMGSPDTNGSFCAGNTSEPYLTPNLNPATGLLIDKIKANPSCGKRMPFPGVSPLTAAQISCVEAWAEGLIMAAQ
jgi:hypothetical protein